MHDLHKSVVYLQKFLQALGTFLLAVRVVCQPAIAVYASPNQSARHCISHKTAGLWPLELMLSMGRSL